MGTTISSGWWKRAAVAVTAVLSVVTAAAAADYPHLDGSSAFGRQIWIDNCESCHAYGIAGAPVPMEPDDWRDRLGKPRALLYQHAIEGFFGPDDTQMPARGGNPKLSDDQIRAAVDYMVALAGHHINKP